MVRIVSGDLLCRKCKHMLRIERRSLFEVVVICEKHGRVGYVVECKDFEGG